MTEYRLGPIEARFADLIWENEPVPSGTLVKLCEEKLEWKKSTTYTMLKRLCQKGLFQNEDGVVVSLVSKAEFESLQSHEFVSETFAGSLPRFIAAFTRQRKLSESEIEELKKLIDDSRR